MKITGIKCDNKTCDYNDDSIKKEEYLAFINKPCPKCGCNLLTQKDYDTVMLLDKITNSFPMRALEKVMSLFGAKTKHMEINMDGSGKVAMEEIKDPTENK
jgi:hypothetical protein